MPQSHEVSSKKPHHANKAAMAAKPRRAGHGRHASTRPKADGTSSIAHTTSDQGAGVQDVEHGNRRDKSKQQAATREFAFGVRLGAGDPTSGNPLDHPIAMGRLGPFNGSVKISSTGAAGMHA